MGSNSQLLTLEDIINRISFTNWAARVFSKWRVPCLTFYASALPCRSSGSTTHTKTFHRRPRHSFYTVFPFIQISYVHTRPSRHQGRPVTQSKCAGASCKKEQNSTHTTPKKATKIHIRESSYHKLDIITSTSSTPHQRQLRPQMSERLERHHPPRAWRACSWETRRIWSRNIG